MKKIGTLVILLVLALLPATASASAEGGQGEKLDIPTIVLEHLADSYEWHIATYEGKHLSIPLPVIVRSEKTGDWHCCTAHSLPQGFFCDPAHHGKIYEKMDDGSTVRPLDLSITKTVAQIWIVVLVMIAIFLSCARWYKSRDEKSDAPSGFVGAVEMLVMTIHDDLIRPSVGEKHYKQYAPYLLTVFFFILITNMVGLIPVMPGGANVTGNINVTLFLESYPVPVMPVIELFGVFTKPFALMIRLFANMMAGHAVILSFTCVIFLGWSMGIGYGLGLNAFSIIMLLFMNCLELLVAFVQDYVFTMLSAVFIGLAHKEHHES